MEGSWSLKSRKSSIEIEILPVWKEVVQTRCVWTSVRTMSPAKVVKSTRRPRPSRFVRRADGRRRTNEAVDGTTRSSIWSSSSIVDRRTSTVKFTGIVYRNRSTVYRTQYTIASGIVSLTGYPSGLRIAGGVLVKLQ